MDELKFMWDYEEHRRRQNIDTPQKSKKSNGHVKDVTVVHSNSYLSKSDIYFLESNGFIQDISKNSGYYFIEDDRKTTVLIPYKDGSYKLEFFEAIDHCDDDSNYCYEDFFDTAYSYGESLEDFLNKFLSPDGEIQLW